MEGSAAVRVLPPVHTMIRMAFVVAHNHHPNIVRLKIVKYVIRKTPQIDPAKIAINKMEAKRGFRRAADHGAQFCFKLRGKGR